MKRNRKYEIILWQRSQNKKVDRMATPEEIEKLKKTYDEALLVLEAAKKEYKESFKAHKEARKKLNTISRAADTAGWAYYDAVTTANLKGYKLWLKKSGNSFLLVFEAIYYVVVIVLYSIYAFIINPLGWIENHKKRCLYCFKPIEKDEDIVRIHKITFDVYNNEYLSGDCYYHKYCYEEEQSNMKLH